MENINFTEKITAVEKTTELFLKHKNLYDEEGVELVKLIDTIINNKPLEESLNLLDDINYNGDDNINETTEEEQEEEEPTPVELPEEEPKYIHLRKSLR